MPDDTRFLVALITAGSSLLVALVSALLSFAFSRKNHRDLELLRDEIDQKKQERDALRDYQYEARKRLYHECGPLLLQLLELSESAWRRIRALARTASQGNLGPAHKSWL